MRQFSVDARYQRFVESEIALTLARVGRDQKQRAAGRQSTIPTPFVDPDAKGEAVILIGVVAPRAKPKKNTRKRS